MDFSLLPVLLFWVKRLFSDRKKPNFFPDITIPLSGKNHNIIHQNKKNTPLLKGKKSS